MAPRIGRGVGHPHQSRRAVRASPDADEPAAALLLQLLLVEDLDADPGGAAGPRGLGLARVPRPGHDRLGEDGRPEVGGRGVDPVPRPGHCGGNHLGRLDGFLLLGAARPGAQHDDVGRVVLGVRRAVLVEPVPPQVEALDRGTHVSGALGGQAQPDRGGVGDRPSSRPRGTPNPRRVDAGLLALRLALAEPDQHEQGRLHDTGRGDLGHLVRLPFEAQGGQQRTELAAERLLDAGRGGDQPGSLRRGHHTDDQDVGGGLLGRSAAQGVGGHRRMLAPGVPGCLR